MLTRLYRPSSTQYAFAVMALTLILVAGLWRLSTGYAPSLESPTPGRGIDLGNLPLAFEANAGQAAVPVRFLARQPQGALFFEDSGVYIAIQESTGTSAKSTDGKTERTEGPAPTASTFSMVHMEFVGANAAPHVEGAGLLPGKVNYLTGDDPSGWHRNLPTYDGITYRELYPGVSLSYSGSRSSLKGTYTLAPNALPSQIRWRYEGAKSVSVDSMGRLQITTNAAEGAQPAALTEDAPVAWQEIGGERVPVSAHYAVASDGSIVFTLGSYDPAYPLTIDPTLTFSTYLGGAGHDWSQGVAVDPGGNVYLTGYTNSTNFPRVNAVQQQYMGQSDAFVTKIDANTSAIIYSTYLGGSASDFGTSVAVDGAGQAYVTGFTTSQDFPVENAFQPVRGGVNDAFLTKLSPDGSAFVYSTYLGGSDAEVAESVAVNAQGNAYIAGSTQSANFPTANAFQPALRGTVDGFLTKFDPAGTSLALSTFLGGSGGEYIRGVAVDGSGNMYVAGETFSNDFPVFNAYQDHCYQLCSSDAFVTKFNPSGQALIYSTYIGGNLGEGAHDIAADDQGNAYITGVTDSVNFPTFNAIQYTASGFDDAFVTKFNSIGQLGVAGTYSTYLGGAGSESGYSIKVNNTGNAYVAGFTQSDNFPLLNPLYGQIAGFEDGFLTKFAGDGQSLLYSTFFGGSNGREEVGARDMAIDGAGNAYLVGNTQATNLPVVNPSQAQNVGGYDVFVAKIADLAPATATPAAGTPTATVCPTNYTYTQTTGVSLVPGTTNIGRYGFGETAITLPFPFRLYDNTYTTANVGTFGYLKLGTNFIPHVNQCLPADQPNMMLMPYWDDLFISSGNPGSGVFTSVSGVAPNRIFNIEWRAIQSNGGAPVNFEIRLYEDTTNQRFDFVYANVGNLATGATIGVQEDFFGRYTQHSCNPAQISNGLQITFTRPACAFSTPTPTRTTTPTRTGMPPTFTPTRTRTNTPVTPSSTPTSSTPSPTDTPVSPLTQTPLAGTWTLQAPLPTSRDINGVFMLSATEGWAATVDGAIIHTTDTGRTWEYQFTGLNDALHDVFFLDSRHGWATGNAMLYTTDGGRNWIEGNAFPASNYDIQFADLNNGLAVGIGGVVYKSTDGGRNWSPIITPTRNNLKNIAYVNPQLAWAVGQDGTILRTTNGGTTWTRQTSGTTAFLDGVSFASPTEGWAVGGDVFLHTTNAGVTWQRQTAPAGTFVFSLDFTDNLNGWAAGPGYNIVHTTDGGATWRTELNSSQWRNESRYLFDISSADGVHALAVGEFGAVWSTDDGGANWVYRQNGMPFSVADMDANDAYHAWTVSDAGAVAYTSDGGAHWDYSVIQLAPKLNNIAVDFTDNLNGWVAGGRGIVHSTDGGRTWEQQISPTLGEDQVWGVYGLNPTTVVVAAYDIYRSTDGGNSWTQAQTPDAYYKDVVFVDQNIGWAVGFQGRIAKSTDGGLTWAAQNSGTTAELNQVSFADRTNGWIAGNGNRLFHTTNGGATWTPQNIGVPNGTYTFVNSVSAISPQIAWIAGTDKQLDGFVKRTTNGGATWITDVTGSEEDNTYSAIAFVDANYGWVAGSTHPPLGGTLRRSSGGLPPTPVATNTVAALTTTPTRPASTPTGVATAVSTASGSRTATPTVCPPETITGEITGADPVSSGALDLDGTASECDIPQSCPSIVQGAYHYDAYTYTNTDTASLCVTVTVYGFKCGQDFEGVLSAAYLGSFNPNNICANYLADPDDYSDPFTGPMSYSFNVPGGATFVVLVEEDQEGLGCENYTLIVTGLPKCPVSTATPMPTITQVATATATITIAASATSTTAGTATATSTSVATDTTMPTSTNGPATTVATSVATSTSTNTATSTIAPVTVTAVATFTSAPCSLSFSDVPANNTFYSFVRCLACRGVISGYSDGTFRPNNDITRGQIAKIVSNAGGFNEDAGAQIYEDMLPNSTFYAWVNRLSRRGHMGGYVCGGAGEPCGAGNRPYFRPNSKATRGQLAKIVANAEGLNGSPTELFYTDVVESHPFYLWIMRLTERNVMSGYVCGGVGEPCDSRNRPYFRPYNNVTRGQASKIVSNTFYPGCTP